MFGYRCRLCGSTYDSYDEETLWGHIQLAHERKFEECQNWETPFMLEECYEYEIVDAILVEVDYKGEYARYALTPNEFTERFGSQLAEGMPEPDGEGNAYTLRPLVHIWYLATIVASDAWNSFFTDMTSGLPDGDIRDGNSAYIDTEQFGSLQQYLGKPANENRKE